MENLTVEDDSRDDSADDDQSLEVTGAPAPTDPDLTIDEEPLGASESPDTPSQLPNGQLPKSPRTERDSIDGSLVLDDISELAKGLFESEFNSIGRYQIKQRLGYGGFGSVYLATDTDLRRTVAIKIPHRHRLTRQKDVERFLEEARTVANLDHPGIVPIYDFGRFGDRCYVVSKFIEGGTLTERLNQGLIPIGESIQIIKHVAEALSYIHQSGIYHRDIKPGNLLLDSSGVCYITDFGLALRDASVIRKQGRIGTYCYMSPEQARGESHLVNNRSDLFSLGVVMYQMLCGALPFVGDDFEVILTRICEQDPEPLRNHDRKIPKELERICLKLLSKRSSSRHRTAELLVEDLDCFLASGIDEDVLRLRAEPSSESRKSTSLSFASTDELQGIVPRGFRSFDEEDASFFRELLPGTRDRNGLPDSIQYWRRRIESKDPVEAFRVGVLYGSSGAGKSSFVKAGLIPVLDPTVTTIFVEATGARTEDQLLSAMRARCDDLPEDLSLIESLCWVRGEPDGARATKVLLVFDQFEQWLHTHRDEENALLTSALRQCDGSNLQCLLLVRDDYWVGVSRLADELEIDLVRSRNMAMVDLFDKRHAQKVLAEYGRGYERLPENLSELTSDQRQFLKTAVNGLAEDGKIVPVQLVTFAEIMKGRDWGMKSLQEVGGTDGVGVRFLDESLGASASIESRVHSEAAQHLLKALLPASDSKIKGSMRSEKELQQICGYQHHPMHFQQMIAILDTDLRLITPTDPSGAAINPAIESALDEGSSTKSSRYFQLTHDFLVPAIRTWLEQNLQLTRRGRAAMQLSDHAQVWNSRRRKQHLPSWIEWMRFSTLTSASQRNDAEKRLMGAATKRHLMRTTAALMVFAACALGGYSWYQVNKTQSLVEQLVTANVSDAPQILDQIDTQRRWSKGMLVAAIESDPITTTSGLHSRLALLRRNPDWPNLFDDLSDHLVFASAQELPLICEGLLGHARLEELSNRLWAVVAAGTSDPERSLHGSFSPPDRSVPQTRPSDLEQGETASLSRLNAVLALAAFDPVSEQWAEHADSISEDLLQQTIEKPQDYAVAVPSLSPVSHHLFESLRSFFRNETDRLRRARAADLLIDLFRDDLARSGEALLDCDQSQYRRLLVNLNQFDGVKLDRFFAEKLEEESEAEANLQSKVDATKKRVNAAAFLIHRGLESKCWKLLEESDDPSARSELIERAAFIDINLDSMLNQFNSNEDASVQSGILLMLGTMDQRKLSPVQRQQLSIFAKRAFEFSPHADVHSAAQWLLMRLDRENGKWIEQSIQKLAGKTNPAEFGWTVGASGQTFIRFTKQTHILEVATHEVTIEQYLKMPTRKALPQELLEWPNTPVGLTDWFEAVEYCRWLTEYDGMTEEDQCHPGTSEELETVRLRADYKNRRGYRLLLPWEWESSCFNGAETRFAMGEDGRLIDAYGKEPDAGEGLHPVAKMKPVPSGLFGMYGNVSEWCTSLLMNGDEAPARGAANTNDSVARAANLTTEGGFSDEINFYSVGFRICRIIPIKDLERDDETPDQ